MSNLCNKSSFVKWMSEQSPNTHMHYILMLCFSVVAFVDFLSSVFNILYIVGIVTSVTFFLPFLCGLWKRKKQQQHCEWTRDLKENAQMARQMKRKKNAHWMKKEREKENRKKNSNSIGAHKSKRKYSRNEVIIFVFNTLFIHVCFWSFVDFFSLSSFLVELWTKLN